MKACEHTILPPASGHRHPGKDLLLVRTECPECHRLNHVYVPEAGYRRWVAGEEIIARAMPGLSADQRERLMTGICGRCWKKLFPMPE